MKKLILLTIFLFVAVPLWAAPLPQSNEIQRTNRVASQLAPTVNSQGTAGAPKSLTTAATIIPAKGNRQSWSLFSETVDIRCEWGDISGNAPATTPTSTVGFLFKAGVLYNNPIDPELRMDCISTGGATNVDTLEDNP